MNILFVLCLYVGISRIFFSSTHPDTFKKPVLSASLEFVFTMTLALLQNDNCYDNWYMHFCYITYVSQCTTNI